MPNVGLVLSGGFAKGAYQVGVLKAVKEFFADGEIKYVSASSVGALNAYAFLQDKMDVAEDMWRNLDFGGFRAFTKNYVRGSHISDAIEKLADTTRPQPFLYVTCFNTTKRKLNYINLKNVKTSEVKDYLRASVMLPMVSRAVVISGMKYIDGALVDNIPVRPIMKHPLDYAIVVHFDNDNYLFENDYFDSKLIKINFVGNSLIKNSLAFDKNSVSYMINSGYEEGISILNMIFKNGIDDLDYIYQKIGFLNGLRGKKKFRLTGDVVVNNINKVLKKIISSKF